MKSGDIAAALVAGYQQQATGTTDIGYHLGVVQAYDDTTGLNSVQILGNTFDNLRVVSAGPAVSIGVGDTVIVLRYQTQYFILGRVSAPGAGSAMRPVAARINTNETTSSTTFTDLTTVGPTVTTYIGPRRSCIVLLSATHYQNNGSASMGFTVSGASTIPADIFRATWWNNVTNTNTSVSVTQVIALSAADGLNQGTNTFTAKYQKGGSLAASFDTRTITVIPF